ncbi:MAG: sigma 54-interacting transcriptional regulator [Anaerotruncus sp.]|nr:sigma 54-interacting transcriptional regulator [Anaerotruncus sp.]
MPTLLMNIQKHVHKYAQMIAAVFDIEVDVADRDKVRIAGTGRFNRMIGTPFYSGRVFSKAMETGKMVMVTDTAHDPLCQNCVNQNFCKDQCEMVFPIKLEGEILGAISLASTNRQQRQVLVQQSERLIAFMSNIVDLIALKAREYRDQKLQTYHMALVNKLIDLIRDGVIVMDGEHKISYMNRSCEKILNYNLNQIHYLHKIHQFSIAKGKTQPNGMVEYLVKIRSQRMHLIGYTHQIEGIEEGQRNTVFTFTDIRTLQEELSQDESAKKRTFQSLIGQSELFLETVRQCKEACYGTAPVLLVGENGVRKEIYARAIHNESVRRENLFIRISLHSSFEKLVEQMVFGHEGEPSTGFQIRNDLLAANTLYVSEVGDLDLGDQEILISILQSSHFYNTKVICATAKDLKALAQQGNFNPDLLYALELYTITIPPLRLRRCDTLLFIDHYLQKFNRCFQKNVTLAPETKQLMLEYSWAGNVREIRNVLSYLVEQAQDLLITPQRLPVLLQQRFRDDKKEEYHLASQERKLIIRALNDLGANDYSKAQVAKALGISKATLYRKLKEYGIQQNTVFE